MNRLRSLLIGIICGAGLVLVALLLAMPTMPNRTEPVSVPIVEIVPVDEFPAEALGYVRQLTRQAELQGWNVRYHAMPAINRSNGTVYIVVFETSKDDEPTVYAPFAFSVDAGGALVDVR